MMSVRHQQVDGSSSAPGNLNINDFRRDSTADYDYYSSPSSPSFASSPPSSYPRSAPGRRDARSPYLSLHTHPEEPEDEYDNDADDIGDECEVRTNSTTSLHHYLRPSSQSPDATHRFPLDAPLAKSWDSVQNQAVPTPPKSPERADWPLPISPKTTSAPFPSAHHDLPPSPRQDDIDSGYHGDVWDEVSTPSTMPGYITPSPAISAYSAPHPGWRLPPSALPLGHDSISAQSLTAVMNPPSYTIPVRSQSLVDRHSIIDRLQSQSGHSWQDDWARMSRATSDHEYPDPHPGTLVDPSRIDESYLEHGTSRPSTSASQRVLRSFNDFAPVRKIPLPANFKVISVEDYFPKFFNNFAGFCKCAWRLQTTQTEKAFVLRTILPKEPPKGTPPAAARRNSKITTLKCKKCPFEGPLNEGEPTSADPKIAPLVEYAIRADRSPKSAHGVTYNWIFLFKSHIPSRAVLKKDETLDPVQEVFGCLFCVAQGNGTICFDGASTLCGHIARHHPNGVQGSGERELNYRLNIVTGRAPEKGEDWDIILPGHYSTYDKAISEKDRSFSA